MPPSTVSISRRAFGAGAAAVLFGLATGCGGRDEPEPPPGEPARVRALTGLGFQGREAYLDVGIAKGWFADAGLEVEVLPGEGTESNLTLLSAGQVEFATLDVSAAIIAYAGGQFTDWTLCSVLHEFNLSCVMALESSGIRRPSDLEGTTIAVIPGGINTVIFPAYAQVAGFDPGSVELVPLPPPSFGAALAEKRVDAIMQFVVGRHTIEQATDPEPVVVLPYSDWLDDLYGSGIAVSASRATQDPDLVRRFNDTAIRALQYAVENPQEAGEIFAGRHEGQDVEAAVAEVTQLAAYVQPGKDPTEDLALGEFSRSRLAQNISVLESLGAIDAPVDPAEVVTFDLARQA
jgi:NitT/TauT family transport system substrate-binding protein